MAKDYYKTLGVEKDASKEDIRKAFRKLAKKYHPDVSAEPDAEEKFKEIQEAYAVLSDDEKRAQYDKFGPDGPQFQGGFDFGGFDFSDIFSSIFGAGFNDGRRANQTGRRRGHDTQISLTIDFMEAALGCTKKLEISREVNCSKCGGSGAKSEKDVKICGNCHGSGFVRVQQQTLFGTMMQETTCPTCHGRGKEIKEKCDKCSGSGRERINKKIDVNIPAGVDNGTSLRVPGYGNDGYEGGPKGDLYIQIKVRLHDVFERRGNDIYLGLPVTFSQAALGDTVEIPTIHGNVDLKVPAGIQSGTTLRLKDKGIIRSNYRKGNQYVVVNVQTPKNLSKDQKKLFKELGKYEEKDKKSFFSKLKSAFKS